MAAAFLAAAPFRVRYGVGGDFVPVSIAPSDLAADIKEAVAAAVGLRVGTFSIRNSASGGTSTFRGTLEGDWEVVLLPGEPGAAAGGGGGFAAAAGVQAAAGGVAAGREGSALAVLAGAVARLEAREARRDFERLFIPPIFKPPSFGSSRSPRQELRHCGLKEETIDFYGLWADKAARTVYTMLAGPGDDVAAAHPAAVPFSEAKLAHICPSSKANDSRFLSDLLHLPANFRVQPRNFLILSGEAKAAFDSEALLLFPSRGPPLSATTRLYRTDRISGATVDDTAGKRARLAHFARRQLYLPRAGEGREPFMRLLAWKVVLSLRATEEEEEAGLLEADPPADLDMAATTTTTVHDDRVVVTAVQRLREAGFRFRRTERG